MENHEQTWAEAMRAGRRGDAAAYEDMLGEIANVLRRLVRRRLARLGLDIHETEDLVQEVLIGLHTKRHTWDEGRPFLPWLHAIVRHKLIDAVRRLSRAARRRRDITPDQWAMLSEVPAEDFDRALVNLDRHVNGLPFGQREVVRALAIEGASVRATALKLQTSEGAVRVTLHRALQRLTTAANLELSKLFGDKA
ncbi:MAG TPA: sigma-70 family RNA polymerase sigma factor [Aliidongia sp.]|nr:sigma-70 family RNA polymerase sigma factor [Aliidongia sp.]